MAMQRLATLLTVALGILLVGAGPAEAQLFNFPVYSAPSSAGGPSTYVFGTYGGGLNENSGKLNAIAAGVGRTGIGERVTVAGGVGIILFDAPADNEVTLAGAVGIDLLPADASVELALNTGIGWMGQTVLDTDFTLLHFPIGVSLGTSIQSESANVSPWIMPRLSIRRVSNGSSDTETNFGVSGGVGITLPAGIGFHVALDILTKENEEFLFGGGVHYVIN